MAEEARYTHCLDDTEMDAGQKEAAGLLAALLKVGSREQIFSILAAADFKQRLLAADLIDDSILRGS